MWKEAFFRAAEACGYTLKEMARLRSGESVTAYRFIPTLDELSRIFSRANGSIRAARAAVYFNAPHIRSRRRIGQGIHDRAEKLLFAKGEELSDFDVAGLKRHQPHPVKFFSALTLRVRAGLCFDFSALADDFALPLGDDLLCSVTIGELILEEGARVCVRGNLFSLSCQRVVKKGTGNFADILILPTEYSYSPSSNPIGETFHGQDGAKGARGIDGHDERTPVTSNSILGTFHFGGERGVKHGGDGTDGEAGEAGGGGLCGGATKAAEIFVYEIEARDGALLFIQGKSGDGGKGGKGGKGGDGGNGGKAGGAYAAYALDRIVSFGEGLNGSGGKGGDGGKGGHGGNGGICSNIFVEVPKELVDAVVCVSEGAQGGSGGIGGEGGAGGIGNPDGAVGKKGADGRKGHGRPGPPMYINSVPYATT